MKRQDTRDKDTKIQRYKRQVFVVIAVIFLIAYSLQLTAYGAEVLSSNELIENAKALDGNTVTYEGEVVTAILHRGDNSWVNLNDGFSAIGVWCRAADLKSVKFIGGYEYKGDVLRVEGIFNRACSIHGGEMDIHAKKIFIVKEGYGCAESMETRKLIFAAVLFLAILATVTIFRKRI